MEELNGLGHLPGTPATKDQDPIETYYNLFRQVPEPSRRKWIVSPDWQPCPIPGMEKFQEWFECHVLPRQWQILVDMWTKFQCGTYFVKRPNWIEPPITATNLDKRNETFVTIPATASGDPTTQILHFVIPDRYVASMLKFGHELSDPAQFGTVRWQIRINNRPVENYADFRQQIGMYVDPTELPVPIRLKHQDVVEVLAGVTGAAAGAIVRFMGFMFPARSVSDDGSFKQYHTI